MKDFLNFFIILISKGLSFFASHTSYGSGSTWPGHIALKFNKSFIKDVVKKNKNLKVFLITGTNGKTTTAKLFKFLAEKNGKRVFYNMEGANLLNGIASSIIKNVGLDGGLKFEVAIFEVDENTLPLVLAQLEPSAIIILNLFRDQLDRYGEVGTIAKKWENALKNIGSSVSLFFNGDDPLIYHLGSKLKNKVYYFGISKAYMEKKALSHDVDSTYCPNCQKRLDFHLISYSHLGIYECPKCKFKGEKIERFDDKKAIYPLPGKYNIYNTNAAILTAKISLKIDSKEAFGIISEFKPAFGRQESVKFKDREVVVLLSKNPTGFNQSIATLPALAAKSSTLLLVLNDGFSDGRDVSWIWDVDFENLIPAFNQIFISGTRAFDLGVRFRYILAGEKIEKGPSDEINIDNKIFINPALYEAVNTAVNKTTVNRKLFILATYSAMLEVRKILTGKKLL